ncbi:MAG: aminotransferase class I/II-fold pyridoxal phosphate-dependent enzyme [Clostridiales bacterium]|nr:aminotransferase class I/II-fold pyridoxal phosphate-dependent enzyme [Clostridiales bacterium]
MKTPIYDFLVKHGNKETISFHMPGHKASDIYEKYGYGDFLNNIIRYDITEIYGADNLYKAEGIIKEGEERYARLYGAKASFFLVNGTTTGILAAILSSVKKGGKLIMARNSHKSVFNALRLGEIQPVYIYPEIVEAFNVCGEIDHREIKNAIISNPDAEAVILPSPNYYGICSNIEKIAEIVHEYNKILIVDEAHGAHLKFSDRLPKSAVDSGADIVINSIHKTIASFTQSAVMHVNSERVDIDNIKDKLQIIQSTSPSYLLMASLDISASIMEEDGKNLVNQLVDNIDMFCDKVRSAEGIKIMKQEDIKSSFDKTKINIDMTELGLTGSDVEKILREKYNIYMEMVSANLVMGLSGVGNSKEDFLRLADALIEIKEIYRKNEMINFPPIMFEKNLQVYHPAELVTEHSKWVDLDESIGCVSGSAIIPYPPGVPLICPGEIISKKILNYLIALKKTDVRILGVREDNKVQVQD